MPTILITGFGPFPGAPFNPTGPLVKALAQLRRPAVADAKIVTHIFDTSYAAVDRDLPALIERHRPDALLMFGLATRTKHLRIETRARNALALLPDVSGAALHRGAIASGAPAAIPMPTPARRLLAATRMARVPAALSRDAGRYLCNYLCWRAGEAASRPGGPRLAAFVHVPLIRRGARPRRIRKERPGAAFISAHSRGSGNPVLWPLGPRFPPSRSALRRTWARTRRSHLAKTGRGDERRKVFAAADLARAGSGLLVALLAAARR